jgi:serine/threonine-protein kinase SRPK3
VLFCDGTDGESIQRLLDTSPPSIVCDFELHGERYPIIQSQPIPHPWRWDDPPTRVELYSVRLIDLGHGTSFLPRT